MKEKINKTEEEWKNELTPEQYNVLRKKGTETPFSGALYHNQESGMYTCAACGNEIFSSDTKFDSGSGWPSFWAPAKEGSVEMKDDSTLGISRVEVICSRCGGHLGHVFPDGPQDKTGQRFCINSAALHFKKRT
jgi:peptide-methionine (R)-S-oxide reductase